MKTLHQTLLKEDFLSICGMTTEMGWKTKRTNLNGLKECEDWLRNNSQNSIDIIFEDKETLTFK